MKPDNPSFYSQWRLHSGAVEVLRDDAGWPSEKLLQQIWAHQRLRRESLRLASGQPVKVLHPGFYQGGGGPDFRQALIQFGTEAPVSGDVEVDLRPSGWRAHGHHANPEFKNVVLQVVWEGDQPLPGVPELLPLKAALEAPIGELSQWLGGPGVDSLPEAFRGRCCTPLQELPADSLKRFLHEAARTRLEAKAAQFEARAGQAGWDQALWEGLFRALGYRPNPWPMQRLAELRPRWHCNDGILLQARLFGISGLLPAEPRGNPYIRQLWDAWWRERSEFEDCLIPRSAWQLRGLRPANWPGRRLALAAAWSIEGTIPRALQKWCSEEIPDRQRPASLMLLLSQASRATPAIEALNGFWLRHWTFNSPRLSRPQPLLGASRTTDLAMNVVFPWLWAHSSPTLRTRVERLFLGWPAGEDNRVLRRFAIRSGVGSRAGAASQLGAAAQQGVLQIVRDYCDQTNAACSGCRLPKVIEEWRRIDEPEQARLEPDGP